MDAGNGQTLSAKEQRRLSAMLRSIRPGDPIAPLISEAANKRRAPAEFDIAPSLGAAFARNLARRPPVWVLFLHIVRLIWRHYTSR